MAKKEMITQRVQNAILSLNSLKVNFKKTKSEYEAKSKEQSEIIIKSFIKSGTDSCTVDGPDFKIKVKLVTPRSIQWDVDALSKTVSKDTFNKIVDKQYLINDIEGLKDYLKSCGVNPKKFMTFIDVIQSVNNNMIEDLSKKGVLDEDKLKDCCSVVESASYLKITEQDKND